jgi:hypothetical protein
MAGEDADADDDGCERVAITLDCVGCSRMTVPLVRPMQRMCGIVGVVGVVDDAAAAAAAAAPVPAPAPAPAISSPPLSCADDDFLLLRPLPAPARAPASPPSAASSAHSIEVTVNDDAAIDAVDHLAVHCPAPAPAPPTSYTLTV